MKFLLPFALFIEAGRWLAPRPLLSPSQAQQAFVILTGGSGVLATAPFRTAAAPQARPEGQELLLVALFAVWALGAALVFARWLAHWWTIHRLTRNAQPAGE